MRSTLLTTVSLTLIVAACGPGSRPADIGTQPASPSATDGASVPETSLIVRDFELVPAEGSVHAGSQINVKNEGPTIHNVWIRDEAGTVVAATQDLRTGESEAIRVDVTAGRYILYCSLPGHESLGIKGILTVDEP